MTKFETIAKIVSRHEGGFSNIKEDRGGATMYGVTERLARAYGYQGNMKDLPKEEAIRIMKTEFWVPTRCEDLPSIIALLVYDYAVNSGVKRASEDLQRALNLEGFGLKVDGRIGNITLKAVNDYLSKPNGLKALIGAYISLRGANFARIIEANPSQAKFNRGWFARLINNLEWGFYTRD